MLSTQDVSETPLRAATRQPILTAYRQQALACAASLVEGPRRTSELRSVAPNAPSILLRNVYGWFNRIERGRYGLTTEGAAALARWETASDQVARAAFLTTLQ